MHDDQPTNAAVRNDALGYVTHIPVTLVLSSVQASGVTRWRLPVWQLDSLVAIGEGGEVHRVAATPVEGQLESWIWKGLAVNLYEDAGESYWYNLMSDEPRVFVICNVIDEDDDDGGHGLQEGELMPVLVTASQDEAMSHMETDDVVLSAPMPPEVGVNLERFVVATYQPVIKKKRRRRNWSDTPPDAMEAKKRD